MINAFLESFSEWLSSTPLSLQIQTISWLVPFVQTIHILAIAAVLSSVGMVTLRIVGLAGGRTTMVDTARRYVPWMWGAIAVLLVTGTILVIGEPGRSLSNVAFQIKMGLLLTGVAAIAVFRTTVVRNAPFWDLGPGSHTLAKVLAVSAFVLFCAIAVFGRWIAYV